MLESLFNYEYCEIFQGTYFEEHLQKAASQNGFAKIIHNRFNLPLKKRVFLSTSISEIRENVCFYFMIASP